MFRVYSPDTKLGKGGGFTLTATLYNLLSTLVYTVSAYFGQFGYALAWYGIVAPKDVFGSRFDIIETDEAGKEVPAPPNMQTDLVESGIILDAVVAALTVGGDVGGGGRFDWFAYRPKRCRKLSKSWPKPPSRCTMIVSKRGATASAATDAQGVQSAIQRHL
jgi:hypothetical protein